MTLDKSTLTKQHGTENTMDKIRTTDVRVSPLMLVLLTLAVFAVGFLLGNQITIIQAQGDPIPAEGEAILEPVYETYNLIETRYVDDVDADALIDGAIDGMIAALEDPFSAYLPPESLTRLNESLSGDLEGIGATITTNDDGNVEVISVLPETPAERAGVQSGDVFKSVDGEDVLGIDQLEVVTRVRGPAGSEVLIVFLRDDEEVELAITRERFEVPVVFTELLEESNVAYIRMTDFNERSRSQLDAALTELDVNNREGLIFDLRGNPGGLLTSVIEVTSAFMPEGVILYEEFGDGREEIFNADGTFAGIEVPVVVLVDGGSASASELLAGALQDNELATIIGDVTFGKGTVQQINSLSNGGGLRLTIARWLTPNRNSISEAGVTPNVLVPLPEDFDFERDGDIQLQAAVEFIIGEQAVPLAAD